MDREQYIILVVVVIALLLLWNWDNGEAFSVIPEFSCNPPENWKQRDYAHWKPWYFHDNQDSTHTVVPGVTNYDAPKYVSQPTSESVEGFCGCTSSPYGRNRAIPNPPGVTNEVADVIDENVSFGGQTEIESLMPENQEAEQEQEVPIVGSIPVEIYDGEGEEELDEESVSSESPEEETIIAVVPAPAPEGDNTVVILASVALFALIFYIIYNQQGVRL